jgi:hypothetical protein
MTGEQDVDRWTTEIVSERWNAHTTEDREALMRYGSRQAPWESLPDAARRILLADPKVSLEGVHTIDAIFRAAYTELAS